VVPGAACAEAIGGTEDRQRLHAETPAGSHRQRLHQEVGPLLERDSIPVIVVMPPHGAGPTTMARRRDCSLTPHWALQASGSGAADGILTADPNIVPQARTLTELSYAEAADLAYYGSEVLLPRTVRPLWEHSIPLRILNTFNPTHSGTEIGEKPGTERELLPAIISSTGLSAIAIGTRDDSWTVSQAAMALHRLADARVPVLMFSQSSSEHSLSLIVRRQDEPHCLRTLGRHLGSMSSSNS
jgi:aspartate kinase